MNRTRVLRLVLQIIGITGLFALVAVVAPWSWLAATNEWLGLGELPADPVVEYLARSLSLFYALFSVLFLLLAADVEHYRRLIKVFGLGLVAFGVAMTVIDLAAGMPASWTASEGPMSVAMGVLILFLNRATSD